MSLDNTSILPPLPVEDEEAKRRRLQQQKPLMPISPLSPEEKLVTGGSGSDWGKQNVIRNSPNLPVERADGSSSTLGSVMRPAAESITPPSPMATPVNLPAVGNKIGLSPEVQAAQQHLQEAQAKATQHHSLVRKIFEGVGTMLAPGLMAAIPGTILNSYWERNQAQGGLTSATENAEREAQTNKINNPPPIQPTNDFELWHQQNPQGTAEEFLKMQEGTKPPAKVDDFQAYLNDLAASQGKKPEQLTPQERLKARTDYQSAGRAAPKENDFEQYYKDYLTDNNLPDSSHNRLRARTEYAKAGQPFGQIHIDMQQAAASDKKKEAGQGKADKANAPYQDAIDAAAEAHEYAAMASGEGDYALTLRFVEATKPKTGFRLTNTEFNAIKGARSSMGDFEALVQKVQGGQSLTPEQRQQMLQIIDTHAANAKAQIAHNNQKFGIQEEAPADNGAPPPGAKVIDFTHLQ